ncbi:NAD(P)-dependent oxidoreductase [Candidatus Poriferisodalis sp.]|uniref:NAD(P)-dependent oxidoreductase n=1 Tax=Candidatus Poriferisodalis sp. TaxID=3101277 RepID=UPI003B018B1D
MSTPAEASALVWAEPAHANLIGEVVDANPGIEWVQLPYAGIESVVDVVTARGAIEWYCGKGVYAEPVAEHALMLALAGLRGMATYARADRWTAPQGHNLLRARVTVLGGGGITESLLRLLSPFGCDVTVVRNRPRLSAPPGAASTSTAGAARVVGSEALADILPGTDVLVLALALTPATTGIIGAAELAALPSHAWVVNVARGGHIVTDDLVAALRAGTIGGAALDVTDPEPLPEDHPLWSLPNCLITPHIGNTPEMGLALLADRVAVNVSRRIAGKPLIGPVHLDLGY